MTVEVEGDFLLAPPPLLRHDRSSLPTSYTPVHGTVWKMFVDLRREGCRAPFLHTSVPSEGPYTGVEVHRVEGRGHRNLGTPLG